MNIQRNKTFERFTTSIFLLFFVHQVTQRHRRTLFLLSHLVLITTLQAVGCILAIGMIVTPAAIVRPYVKTPDMLFPVSGLVGALGSSLGLVLSIQLQQPTGASIATTLATLFVPSVGFRFLPIAKK